MCPSSPLPSPFSSHSPPQQHLVESQWKGKVHHHVVVDSQPTQHAHQSVGGQVVSHFKGNLGGRGGEGRGGEARERSGGRGGRGAEGGEQREKRGGEKRGGEKRGGEKRGGEKRGGKGRGGEGRASLHYARHSWKLLSLIECTV